MVVLAVLSNEELLLVLTLPKCNKIVDHDSVPCAEVSNFVIREISTSHQLCSWFAQIGRYTPWWIVSTKLYFRSLNQISKSGSICNHDAFYKVTYKIVILNVFLSARNGWMQLYRFMSWILHLSWFLSMCHVRCQDFCEQYCLKIVSKLTLIVWDSCHAWTILVKVYW